MSVEAKTVPAEPAAKEAAPKVIEAVNVGSPLTYLRQCGQIAVNGTPLAYSPPALSAHVQALQGEASHWRSRYMEAEREYALVASAGQRLQLDLNSVAGASVIDNDSRSVCSDSFARSEAETAAKHMMSELNAVRSDGVRKDHQIKRIEVENGTLHNELCKLVETARKQEVLLSSKDAELDSINTRVGEVTALAQEREALVQQRMQEVESTRAERARFKADLDHVRSELSQANSSAAAQEEQYRLTLAQAKAHTIELEGKVEGLVRAEAFQNSSIEMLRKDEQNAMAALAVKDETIAMREVEIRSTKAELTQAVAEARTFEERLQAKSHELMQVEALLVVKGNELAQTQGELQGALSSTQKAEQCLVTRERELETARDAVQNSSATEQNLRLALEQKECEHLNELVRLRTGQREDIEKVSRTKEQYEQRLVGLEANLAESRSRQAEAAHETESWRSRCSHLEEANKRLHLELMDALHRIGLRDRTSEGYYGVPPSPQQGSPPSPSMTGPLLPATSSTALDKEPLTPYLDIPLPRSRHQMPTRPLSARIADAHGPSTGSYSPPVGGFSPPTNGFSQQDYYAVSRQTPYIPDHFVRRPSDLPAIAALGMRPYSSAGIRGGAAPGCISPPQSGRRNSFRRGQ